MNLIMQTIPSPLISELLCQSELDGIILDTEHGHFNNETLYNCIQIITLSNKQCFVRFTDLNKQLVRMCLDAGVDGVVFSTVEHTKYVNEIIKYCTFPSQGGKRGCGLVRQNKWGKKQLDVYKPIIIGKIETRTAIEKIHDFIEDEDEKECNLDFYLIGPYDISSSLGTPGQWDDKTYLKYIKWIYDAIPLNKLGLYLSDKDIENFDNLNNKPPFLVWGIDVNFILKGLDNLNKKIQENGKYPI